MSSNENERKADGKEEQAKRESLRHPGKDDVHEQRELDQPAEGLVEAPPEEPGPPPPKSSSKP